MKKLIILLVMTLLASNPVFAEQQASFFYNRAEARFSQENYQGAIEDLTKSLYMDNKNVKSYILRAKSHSQLGNHRAAIVDFNMCTRLASDGRKKASCLQNCANQKAKLKDYAGAVEDYSQSMELFKRLEDFPNYKVSRTAAEKYKELLESQKEMQIKKQGAILTAKDYMFQAKLEFEKNNYKNAIENMTKATELDSNNPFIYKMRARAWLKVGDKVKALKDLYKTRDLYEEQKNFEGYESTLNLINKLQK